MKKGTLEGFDTHKWENVLPNDNLLRCKVCGVTYMFVEINGSTWESYGLSHLANEQFSYNCDSLVMREALT
jgi:hypothetical protein